MHGTIERTGRSRAECTGRNKQRVGSFTGRVLLVNGPMGRYGSFSGCYYFAVYKALYLGANWPFGGWLRLVV